MEKRAPQSANPSANDPSALEEGLDHYKENCVICHNAPGVPGTEISKGLNPPAPSLDSADVQELKDGEIFWTIKNGIRMTGMPAFGPTHSDHEIWEIAAFVRHLPKLTNEEKEKLKPAAEEEEHHHEHHGTEAPEHHHH